MHIKVSNHGSDDQRVIIGVVDSLCIYFGKCDVIILSFKFLKRSLLDSENLI